MVYDRFTVKSDQFCAISEGNKNMSWNYPNRIDWFTCPTACHVFEKLKRKKKKNIYKRWVKTKHTKLPLSCQFFAVHIELIFQSI